MSSSDNKITCKIENSDRISELPEPLIIDIISRLTLEDAARASILSKTWKNFCSLYPIYYFDHNMFALQSLVSSKEGGQEPDINQIKTMFMDDVDYHLSRAKLLNFPIRKLALVVFINDSLHFSRVDTWLESVRQLKVQDLCVLVRTADSLWGTIISKESVVYEFPVSVLGSKGLRSVCVQNCKLVCDTFVPDLVNKSGVSFSSLQSLCLRNVYINEDVLEYLIRFCQGIETLVLQDDCAIEIKLLKLSKFPKLKKLVIETNECTLERVDIVDTNLECLRMMFYRNNVSIEINMSPEACAGIRELSLLMCTFKQPSLLKDLTTTFPIIEEVDIRVHEIDSLKATSNVLRKLHFFSYDEMLIKQVYIDCPYLTSLRSYAPSVTDLYVNCPKLRQSYLYRSTFPERLFFRTTTDLEKSRCHISKRDASDTLLWFINLKAFLVHIMGSTTNVLQLDFPLPVATFKREELEAIQVSPKSYNVHLEVWYIYNDHNMTDAAAIVDAMLWIIRPTTLELRTSRRYNLVKYLCENLMKKSQDNIGDDEQVTHPCWMHPLKDFQVESPLNTPVINEDLVYLLERCRTMTDEFQVLFKFQWF